MSSLWFLAIVPATGLAWLGILLYFELRNQHHIWHDPCITPANRRDDIRLVLRILHGVLAESGVTWWLDYGTLLGAWRLGDLMAFDHDLDLSFLGEDSARLAACGPALALHGIELDLAHTRIYYLGDKIGDMESWWQHGARLCRDDPAHRSGLPKYWRPLVDDFPARWVNPVARIRFIGALYPCPNSPEAFLRRRYLTCRLHLRLVIPHKQKCWISREFWSEARRIWTYRDAPRIERYETRP